MSHEGRIIKSLCLIRQSQSFQFVVGVAPVDIDSDSLLWVRNHSVILSDLHLKTNHLCPKTEVVRLDLYYTPQPLTGKVFPRPHIRPNFACPQGLGWNSIKSTILKWKGVVHRPT